MIQANQVHLGQTKQQTSSGPKGKTITEPPSNKISACTSSSAVDSNQHSAGHISRSSECLGSVLFADNCNMFETHQASMCEPYDAALQQTDRLESALSPDMNTDSSLSDVGKSSTGESVAFNPSVTSNIKQYMTTRHGAISHAEERKKPKNKYCKYLLNFSFKSLLKPQSYRLSTLEI
jgi:hypothetical protein